MQLSNKSKRKVILNLTSLIDVLFILIIFFTVSSTFLEQPGIELKLPEAESSESHTTQKVIIYIDNQENFFLNDIPIDRDLLTASVESLISSQTDKSVVLRADEGVRHGLIISVMDQLRKKGIYKIIISTIKLNIRN